MDRLGDDGRDWLRANFQATSTNMLLFFFISPPLQDAAADTDKSNTGPQPGQIQRFPPRIITASVAPISSPGALRHAFSSLACWG